MKMDEHDVIDAFVIRLGDHKGYPNLAVDRWPDKENRTQPEIDAVAGVFAIEHTSIDSVANQRQLDDWYWQVVGGLDHVIENCVDCGFTITLGFYAIGKGMDWNCIRADLQKWIVGHASRLGKGNHKVILPTSTPVEFPIVMHVWKGLAPSIVGFARFQPEDDTLAARIRTILDRKAMKLSKYQGLSATTILLVENDDIALMNEFKMLDAIREAYPDGLPQGVDETWFADTSIPDKPQFHDFTTKIVNECHRPSPPQ